MFADMAAPITAKGIGTGICEAVGPGALDRSFDLGIDPAFQNTNG